MHDLPPLVDMDLRLVRSFAVLAHHRHFGRAAEALHSTQPALSRQISRLEQQVGVRLLERSSRGTVLTEAGKVFESFALDMLRSASNALAQTRAVESPSRITIGYITNIIVTPAVRALRRLYPEAEVHTQHLTCDRPPSALLQGDVDVVLGRLPLPLEGLEVSVLYDEPRVVLVPADHRLAGKESVTIDDIVDEPLPRTLDPAWNAFWRMEPRSDGKPAPDGPLIDDLEDRIESVAAGESLAVVPASPYLNRLRPDVTSVPLHGVEPSHVVIATRAQESSHLVRAFETLARTYLPVGGPRNPSGSSRPSPAMQ
ncbi:LysR family transcriptional regulator [Actinoplanes sp. LDG1-06]|uniref:LysR family transcriptional regulator n=1 Tax=Paractinoplanes ovalisporus TaxID=2810368 RepID=A0ABS2AML1_9ACTN|nr:LysR family transcriptional regulator [Actinoplanes ovalisporus]MBM2620466.1 LysR family transcriptional regulator [Actinoplanes ovalisporus]